MQEKTRGELFGRLSKIRESLTSGLSGLCKRDLKLVDATKGSIIIAIAEKLSLPIRFIGVGEPLDDLRPFVAQDFAQALLPESLGDNA